MRELFLRSQSAFDSSGNFRCAVYTREGASIDELIPAIRRITIVKHACEDGVGVFFRAVGSQCIFVINPSVNDGSVRT